MSFTLEYFGASELGYVRANNEDIWQVLPDRQFFILADGMGGHNAGEVAATLAVQSMCSSVEAIDKNASIEQLCMLMREAVSEANAHVFEESTRHAEYAGMGTTLSCFIIKENFLIYAHVGDSRLYRFRGKLEKLTEDHSLRQGFWVQDKEATPSILPRNVITRAIGTQPTIYPDIGVIALHPGDLYMLCSDGLSDYVVEQEISSTLSSSLSLQEMGYKLIETALEKGGNDNITLLLVRLA